MNKKETEDFVEMLKNFKTPLKWKLSKLFRTKEQKDDWRLQLFYVLSLRQKKKLTKEEKLYQSFFEDVFRKELDKLDYQKELKGFNKMNKSEEAFTNQMLNVLKYTS